ncbi:ribosome silencing factor [Caulifigura coniformis]|uniref:ribosome silencing factor n=1 Tax=Caulifigura coniformis TaxID=2527983 RepID=UPI0011A3ABD5|nr:ribosome silencing factor [Caulifigura coniformis]
MPVVSPTGSVSRSRSKAPDRRAAIARSRELAILSARSCDDFRGKDTLVLDVSHITPLFDYFVITTGTNPRQIRAIADGVEATMKEHGSPRQSVDGRDSGNWIVQDYGDVVLHVFTPEGRSQYDLEGLWGDAKRVDW